MPIISQKFTSIYPIPPAGLHVAVCVDVIDLGLQPGFQGVPTQKVDFVWELETKGVDGKRYNVRSRYTNSIHPKSNMGRMLASWCGVGFEQRNSFDLETMIGQACQVQVMHRLKSEGRIRAWASIVLPPPQGMNDWEVEYDRNARMADIN